MSGDIVELPLDRIYSGPQVRDERLDLDHVEAMRGVEFLPPISVRETAKGYECLDGAHRCAAARRDELTTIRGVVHEFDDAEALEFAYLANNDHGLPLTLKEKKAGARRFINETLLSDGQIAKVVGLHRDTVAKLRPVQPAENQQVGRREGADGKARPSDKAAAKAQREAIAVVLREHPDLSLNEVARRIGCAPMTVASVRTELARKNGQQDGEPPPAPPAGLPTGTADAASEADGDQRDDSEEGSPTAPGKHLGVVPPIEPGAPTVADTVPHYPTPGKWHEADGAKATNSARDFAKFMDRRALRSDEQPADVAAACPAPLRSQAIACARVQAAAWAALADALDNPQLRTVEDAR